MAVSYHLAIALQLDYHARTMLNNHDEDEHMEPSISPEELKKILERGLVLLLDVRRKADYDADPGTIPGAAWRNPEQVDAWSQEIPKGQRVVVYCVKGGSVSQSITAALVQKYIQACYIEGGLKAWKESSGPRG
jgi:rhodanese-related sulfurtransferase